MKPVSIRGSSGSNLGLSPLTLFIHSSNVALKIFSALSAISLCAILFLTPVKPEVLFASSTRHVMALYPTSARPKVK
jgi:hypothetical protein